MKLVARSKPGALQASFCRLRVSHTLKASLAGVSRIRWVSVMTCTNSIELDLDPALVGTGRFLSDSTGAWRWWLEGVLEEGRAEQGKRGWDW